MTELPRGTVTLLFTDIEGSTRLLKQLGDRYAAVLDEHHRILREAAEEREGREVDNQGDSFFFAFPRAKDALGAAVVAQKALAEHEWPEGAQVRVRLGLHTGEPEVGGERYVGLEVHRAARIGAAAHGGQVLLSSVTRDLVEGQVGGVSVRELGSYRLKDMDRPERLFQVDIEGLQTDFPPLRGAELVKPPRPLRRRSLLAAALAGVIAAAVAIPVFAIGGGSGGGVALAGVDGNAVGAIDPASGRIASSIPVGTSPGSVAAGAGSIWVTNADSESVSRIDPKTNAVVQTIQVGSGPSGVAVGDGFVWVANSLAGTVAQIDPRTNGVVQQIPTGNQPTGVAFGAGGLWVANSTDSTVVRIDPRTGTTGKPIPVEGGADAIAVGPGAVWVTGESAGIIARIDPSTGSIIQTINVGSGPAAVAAGARSVWVANAPDGTVSRIDPQTNRVEAAIQVGSGPGGVAVTPDGMFVWVANEFAGTLSKIDTAQNKVVQTVRTGNQPKGVALTGNSVYVAVGGSGVANRGGTLTISSADDTDFSPVQDDWRRLNLTNDGLTGFRRASGSSGAHLVPDLAVTLPTPTDGGTTYTFRLRPGIRYSTGAMVQPADFRRAIQRVILNQSSLYGGFYFTEIVGAVACVEAPKRCDLTKGIVVNRRSGTITFHLTAPDPDFLYKLALPEADAVAAGTPLTARAQLPATGPYMVESATSTLVRLVRNPHFHEWSAAAQPSGYPDEIVFRRTHSDEAGVRAVERDASDLTEPGHGHILSVLRTRYASQLHTNPGSGIAFFPLNTRVPPFDNVDVRRAVNYALDRNSLAGLAGGPGFAQPSCQILPPNFDGYRRYCPYTIAPKPDGTYTGPDLAKARRLVATSGTKGQRVTVWILQSFAPVAAYLVSALNRIGYRARLKIFPGKNGNAYFNGATDSRRKVQAFGMLWSADYPAPGGTITPTLSCGSFHPHTPGQSNFAEFCDRKIDAEIARARALQTTDRPAASRLWRKVDHDLVDQAPWAVQTTSQSIWFVSRRVRNFQYHPVWGPLLDQIWVK